MERAYQKYQNGQVWDPCNERVSLYDHLSDWPVVSQQLPGVALVDFHWLIWHFSDYICLWGLLICMSVVLRRDVFICYQLSNPWNQHTILKRRKILIFIFFSGCSRNISLIPCPSEWKISSANPWQNPNRVCVYCCLFWYVGELI